MAVSFVAAGTAAKSVGDLTDLTPDLPAGLQVDDFMVLFWACQAGTDTPTLSVTGWTQYATHRSNNAVLVYIYTRRYQSGDTAPTVDVTVAQDPANNSTVCQIAAFRGVSTGITDDSGWTDGASGANVGPIAIGAALATEAGGAVLVLGSHQFHDNGGWATLSGDGLTWAEIGDFGMTTGVDISPAWDYALTPTQVTVTDKTFARSFSGDSGVWTGIALALDGAPEAIPGVWVDWDGDGFEETPGNITSDVVAFSWHVGGAADHVSAQNPGGATITVKNADGKYNPDNGSSVLSGLLKPGRPVWIGLNADGTLTGTGQTVYPVFAGYLREIVPLVENGATAHCDLICEDALGSYDRRQTRIAASTSYSYKTLRQAILTDIGETNTTDLASEIDTLPLAGADSTSALAVLEEINLATASRHWTKPGATKEDFYNYTTVDRHHKLTLGTADASINADDVQAISGYRVTADNVINYQQVNVSPVHFPSGDSTVWTYETATFGIGTATTTLWATFDDYVTGAALDYDSSGGTVTATLTNFGTTAKIALSATSAATITNLSITGRQVVRDPSVIVVAEDTDSQDSYVGRAANSISPQYASTAELAQGVADFLVWKFADPLKRPAITFVNELPTSLARDLYDVITLTVDRLNVSARRFEIIGMSGSYEPGPKITVTWELQETPNQSALDLFILDTSLLDSDDQLAR